jgi:hypothetical protein
VIHTALAGLEKVQFALVKAGINQGAFLESRFIETVTDEDRLPQFIAQLDE